MTFLVFNIDLHKEVSSHATERGARISLKATQRKAYQRYERLKAQGMSDDYNTVHQFDVCSAEDFHRNDTYVTVLNLMSKKPVQIRKSQVGGCCDPSTETYWSM